MARRILLVSLLIFSWACLTWGQSNLQPDVAKSLTTGLQEFGDSCNYAEEEIFYKALNKTKFADISKFINDNKPEKYKQICNRFKYLNCEPVSHLCVCRKQTFWVKNTTRTTTMGMTNVAEEGDCRLKERITQSCHSNLSPRWIQEPVELNQINYASLNLTMIGAANGTHCDFYTNSHICNDTEMGCPTAKDKLKLDLKEILKDNKINGGWLSYGGKCSTDEQKVILKDGKVKYSIDVNRLKKVLTDKAMQSKLCNFLAGHECVEGVCTCGEDTNPVTMLITVSVTANPTTTVPTTTVPTTVSRTVPTNAPTNAPTDASSNVTTNVAVVNVAVTVSRSASMNFIECKMAEGSVCSKYYWHDGDWVEDFDLEICGEGLVCLLAPDEINHICCSPNNTVTGEGRCRCNEFIPFLRTVSKNNSFVKCESSRSHAAKYVTDVMVTTIMIVSFLLI